MKKNAIFLICLILSIMAIGQSETQNLKVDKEEVEVTPPKFTGIENGAAILEADNSLPIKNYLLKNLNCHGYAADCWEEGTEIVQFTVTPSGKVTSIKVINSVSPKIDEELIRVLKTTNGMWKPGYSNGEPTAMEKEVSLLFKAGDYNYSAIVEHFNNKALEYFKKGSMNLYVKNKPKKALRFYNKGVQYRPNDKGLLLLRGMCNYELGNNERARRDWNRIANLGGIDPGKFDNDLVGMKGYSKMTNILAKTGD
jgi:tetratricopeptide (TPR) repeat protein